ncbi:MAG: sigma-70 family RNA polymerase sigma factor [Bacteroidetes bacterium]|nr:sigma-70 family RNA polymerase sigma factor [Bacteroidota bacterium]
MHNDALIPHLFRTEYRKIVSVLCKRFGLAHVETAEDIAGDTFLSAMQSWGLNGIPPNPVAWLYNVAKNKAKNHLQRQALFDKKISPQIKTAAAEAEESGLDLSPQNINDSQLQMMFAVCHPSIPAEAQVGLALRILCGFGIEEIADAFLTTKDTINKRLYRAREKLREEKIAIALPAPADIESRLSSVLSCIYLLFNEGYYSVSTDKTLRRDLCYEAMRLCTMLVENNSTNTPAVNALLALMCFHASRFDARIGEDGAIILYEDQDSSRWNTDLISKGGYFLQCAQSGMPGKYHFEAAIAYWNTQQADTKEKWESILQLYNRLLQLEYSPMAALNRTFALSKANGKEQAIAEAEKLGLEDNRFYWSLLGELYSGTDEGKARDCWKQALALAKTDADRAVLQRKMNKL